MKPEQRWPFIAPHCRRMGSFRYYDDEQYAEARRVNAPRDTYALSRHDGGRIYRASEMDEGRRAQLERDAGVTVASVLGDDA